MSDMETTIRYMQLQKVIGELKVLAAAWCGTREERDVLELTERIIQELIDNLG